MTEKISAELLAHWDGEILDSRVVPGQGLCAVRHFIYTDGLMTHVQIDRVSCGFEARYCYEDRAAALKALHTWDGKGDPPGPWIKEKTSERLGPGARVTDEERARHERIRLRSAR